LKLKVPSDVRKLLK